MSNTLVTAGGTLEVDDQKLARLFRRVPGVTAFHLRDTIGAIMGSHRREFLADTAVQVTDAGKGFRVAKMQSEAVNAPNRQASRKNAFSSFFYTVRPAKVNKDDKNPQIQNISAEAFTTSKIAYIHEVGGTVRPRSRRMLAIPVGMTLRSDGKPIPRWRTPAKYRASKAGNDLVVFKRGKKPLLWAVLKGTGKNARTSGAVMQVGEGQKKKSDRRILAPAYRLVPSVKMQPRLRFITTWERLAPDRTRRIARMFDRIVEEA